MQGSLRTPPPRQSSDLEDPEEEDEFEDDAVNELDEDTATPVVPHKKAITEVSSTSEEECCENDKSDATKAC